jgi:hypothetical protein
MQQHRDSKSAPEHGELATARTAVHSHSKSNTPHGARRHGCFLSSSSMADVVGLVASILQLVDTAVKAREYIQDFCNAPKDQARLLMEIRNLQPLILELDKRIQANQAAGLTKGMAEFRAPLIQWKGMIEELVKRLDLTGFRKVASRLTWPLWGKDDVQEELDTVEQFKGLLSVWLDMDIWSVISIFG